MLTSFIAFRIGKVRLPFGAGVLLLFGAVNALGQPSVASGKPHFAVRVLARADDMLVCAKISNRDERPMITTAPFTFAGRLQLLLIITDLQDRTTNPSGFISSIPHLPNAADRLNYDVLYPGDGREACTSLKYRQFQVAALKMKIIPLGTKAGSSCRLQPWRRSGMPCRYNSLRKALVAS